MRSGWAQSKIVTDAIASLPRSAALSDAHISLRLSHGSDSVRVSFAVEVRDGSHGRFAGAVRRPPPGKRGAQFLAALVRHPGSIIRRLAGGDRAQQMQFTRLLRNESVTIAEMATCAGERTAPAAAGREVLAIQDSSELVFGGKKARARGFGPIGRGGATGGLLLHAMLAVDALTGGVLGAVDLQVRNRAGRRPKHRRARLTAQKESQRWLDGMTRAATVLAAAQRITVIADSESDIYEEYARRPANVHLITRVAQDRRLADSMGTSLLALADGLPEQARHTVTIPAAPGRPQRQAVLALRFAPVRIRKPKHGAGPDLPACVEMELVDIREVDAPAGVTAIHWRLLTTHRVDTPQAARMILDFY